MEQNEKKRSQQKELPAHSSCVVQAWTDALLGGEWHVMGDSFFRVRSIPAPPCVEDVC
jgi:hypothetical protein